MTIVEIDLEKNTWFEMYFCISVSVTPSHVAGNWKSLNQEIRPEKKKWTHKILTRKTFGLTKYPREKVFSQRNTQEKKFRTDEIPKYPREQISDPRINHKKKVWTYKKPTRKNFRPTKVQWHDGTRPTRPMMARVPWGFAHSYNFCTNH